MQALGVCFRSLLEPGDEVVVPAPCFFFGGADPRPPAASRSTSPAPPADGWRWDLERARAGDRAADEGARSSATPATRPATCPRREEVAAAVALAERHGLVVVTDEAYEASLWDGATLTSAFGLGDDVIVIRSLGKSLSMPQLRIGMLAGPAARVDGVHAHARVGLPARRRRLPGGGARRARRARGTGSSGSTPASAADRDVALAARRGDARARRRRAARGAVPLRRLDGGRTARGRARGRRAPGRRRRRVRGARATRGSRSAAPPRRATALREALDRWARLHAG